MKKYFILSLLFLISISANSQSGTIDPTFNTGSGFDGHLKSLNLQPDGKFVVGGAFDIFNGLANRGITRLNADGSLDLSFNTGAGLDNFPGTSALQQDGKILLGGLFNTYNGFSAKNIARINPDGSFDPSFVTGTGFTGTGTGIVEYIYVQDDGKILVGGRYSLYNGTAANRLVRLNPDGSLDPAFNIGSGFNNHVMVIAVQNDGKILAGGYFTTFNGTTVNRIVRLNPDGSHDTSFNTGSGFNDYVKSFAIQDDGKILVGGFYTTFNGTTANRIIRLNPDGTEDTSFNKGSGFNNTVAAIYIQDDGKLLMTGGFTSYKGVTRNRIVRLYADGNVDLTFDTGSAFDDWGTAIVLPNDTQIVIVGNFSIYDGVPAGRIVRLSNCISSSSFLTETACNSYTLNNQTYTTSGIYTQSLTNAPGCDSIITLDLTINHIDTSVTQTGSVLTANNTSPNVTYQWIDCNNNSNPLLPGETNQTFTATVNGSYAVVITESGCSDTSACFSVVVSGIESIFNDNKIIIYPVPATNFIHIKSEKDLDGAVVKLMSTEGKIIEEKRLTPGTNHSLDIGFLPSGIYHLEIKQNKSQQRFRIVRD